MVTQLIELALLRHEKGIEEYVAGILTREPSLVASWIASLSAHERLEHLKKREKNLSFATLDALTINLLFDEYLYFSEIYEHVYLDALRKSRLTESIPLTSVTVLLGGLKGEHTTLLVSKFGSQEIRLSRRALRLLGKSLPHGKLSRKVRQNVGINPVECHPHEFYGLAPGIVSPFLPKNIDYSRVGGIVLLESSFGDYPHRTNIPLSCRESLVLPSTLMFDAIRKHRCRFHPQLPLGIVGRNNVLIWYCGEDEEPSDMLEFPLDFIDEKDAVVS